MDYLFELTYRFLKALERLFFGVGEAYKDQQRQSLGIDPPKPRYDEVNDPALDGAEGQRIRPDGLFGTDKKL